MIFMVTIIVDINFQYAHPYIIHIYAYMDATKGNKLHNYKTGLVKIYKSTVDIQYRHTVYDVL